jgi:hypothetical protein
MSPQPVLGRTVLEVGVSEGTTRRVWAIDPVKDGTWLRKVVAVCEKSIGHD